MEDFISKDFAAEIKAVEGERALNVTITTNDVDRSGDIVEPKGARLANFKKNPVVLMAHDYQGLPIGKAKELDKTDKGITAKVIFPDEGVYPLADTVYNMYKQKFMRAWSIGFMPIKSEDIVDDEKGDKIGRGRRFKTWELIEFSACPVPNNPNALTNMVEKGINIDTLKEAGFITIVEEKKDEDEILEKDIITKPEETDDFIRIPVKGEEGKHKGHKIRWMNVSTKEGIRGIYCIDCKKIITFVFAKDKGWTMAKAKKWMVDHGKIVSNYFLNIDPDSFKDLEAEEIDWDEVKANIEKEEKKELKDYPKFKYYDGEGNEVELDDEEDKDYEAMAGRFCEKYLTYRKLFEDSEKKLKDIELKVGAVLNAKNKSNLKQAIALVQGVLDSAGEEEGQEGEEEEDNKKDDTVIIIKDDKKEDPPKDEKTDEKTITIDEKVVAKVVTKTMNQVLGITDK